MLATLGFTKKQLHATFVYLFKGMSNKEFRTHFENGMAAKRSFDSNGYVLMNCKLYAWAHYKGVKPSYKDYRISKEDAKFLRTLDLSFANMEFVTWELDEFRASVEQQLLCKAMDQYIGKFISKKLLFLRAYGLTRADMVNDLRAAALYSVYRMFPFYESLSHMQNIGKSALKRAGQDLIYTHTRKSRQCLYRNADGSFQSVLVSMDAKIDETRTVQDLLDSRPYLQAFDITRKMELLSNAYDKCSPRAKRFISLLLGEYDDGFTKFLGRNNTRVYNKLDFNEYCRRVQSHMGISSKQRNKFFQKLRRL